MSGPVIEQDYEVDDDGRVEGALSVFWAKGHGYDPRAFIRAVVDYCLDNDIDIPRIGGEPVETWQRNVESNDGVFYQRNDTAPTSPCSTWFPVTLLDLERPRRHGAPKCSIKDCTEPWWRGQTVPVAVEPTDAAAPYMSLSVWLCLDHAAGFPAPSYRVRMVPVGATILLPAPTEATQ
jgi:hypothetical protein